MLIACIYLTLLEIPFYRCLYKIIKVQIWACSGLIYFRAWRLPVQRVIYYALSRSLVYVIHPILYYNRCGPIMVPLKTFNTSFFFNLWVYSWYTHVDSKARVYKQFKLGGLKIKSLLRRSCTCWKIFCGKKHASRRQERGLLRQRKNGKWVSADAEML